MDATRTDLYGGITEIQLATESFDLGEGLELRKTYAFIFATYMMAHTRAPEGKHHPAPWSPVAGGQGVDVNVEIVVPASFYKANFFDQLNTIWLVTCLLRLLGHNGAHAAVISQNSVSQYSPSIKSNMPYPMEFPLKTLQVAPGLTTLETHNLQWLKKYWLSAGILLRKNKKFSQCFYAYDTAKRLDHSSSALMMLWGALESLFSPAKTELAFRISANIAVYLEKPGKDRLDLYQHVKKLYDARSSVAHGTEFSRNKETQDTFKILDRVMKKIIEHDHVPNAEDLLEELLAPTP